MNENDRLEVVLAANFQKALTAIQSTNTELKNTVMLVKNVKANFDGTDASTKSLNASLSKTQKILNTGFNFGKLYLLWNITKRIRDTIAGWIKSSVDFIETTNKFEVAMGNASDKAYSFQRKLSEAFGTLSTDMMNFQATFKNIMSAIPGLTNDAAEQVSETLVKLGLDYSSLYNVDQSTAMSRIQSALVGSVKPIRNDAGYDITEATIGRKSQELGIETSVRNLNQMEKRILRIIVLMDQMRNTGAMQDLARTIEQPANQIKVLKQQVQELGIWLGNVFIGTIGKILPYINGFVMALVAIIKTLAIFVGYTNTGSGLAEGLQEAETASTGIASGVGSAAKSAKELKKTLMGFDVLNVIQKPQESSGGGGGGGGANLDAINPAILNALRDYDNLMNKVKMKATDIRDKIMDWLGFTKLINPLTGEITWKLKEGTTRFKTILNILKTAVGLIAGIKILGKLRNLITLLKTGTSTGLKPFSSGLVGVSNAIKGSINWLKDGVVNYKALRDAGYGVGSALKETASGMAYIIPTAVKATVGIAGLAASMYGAYDSMKDLAKGTKDASAAYTELGISIAGAAASGALLGFTFGGGIGAAIGAVTGALIAGTTALLTYENANDKVKQSLEQNKKAHEDLITKIEYQESVFAEAINSKKLEAEQYRNLANELSNYLDSTGKVKKGYEERVSYILNELNNAYQLELGLTNGQITKNGEYIGSNAEVIDSINKVVKAKENEYALEVYQKEIIETKKNSREAYYQMTDAINNQNDAEKELIETFKRFGKTQDDVNIKNKNYEAAIQDIVKWSASGEQGVEALRKKFKKLEESKEQVRTATATYEKETEKIVKINDALMAHAEGNEEKTKRILDNLEELYSEHATSYSKEIERIISDTEVYKKSLVGTEEEITQKTEIERHSRLLSLAQNLADETRTVKELTDDQKKAWQYLAKEDREAYNKALEGLDGDAKKLVQSVTGQIISETNSALPKVKSSVGNIRTSMGELSAEFKSNPKITIDPRVELNTYNLRSKLNTLNNTLLSSNTNGIISRNYTDNLDLLSNRLKSISKFASGGLPNIGELFMAREAGPELVGSIGNRSAVMNNQQIVEAVSTGVANAVSNVLGNGNSSYQLIIDGEQITDVVQRRLARRANITGMAMGV